MGNECNARGVRNMEIALTQVILDGLRLGLLGLKDKNQNFQK